MSFDADSDQQNYSINSNINNRNLNMSSVLDDLGLKQYKTLFDMEEVRRAIYFFFF